MVSNPIMNMDIDITFFIAVTAVPDVECPKIKVTGSDFENVDGTYYITGEKASKSSKPVFKKQGYERFIFHYPTSGGWSIGVRDNLSPYEEFENGTFRHWYWFEGKLFSKESLIELYISHI